MYAYMANIYMMGACLLATPMQMSRLCVYFWLFARLTDIRRWPRFSSRQLSDRAPRTHCTILIGVSVIEMLHLQRF